MSTSKNTSRTKKGRPDEMVRANCLFTLFEFIQQRGLFDKKTHRDNAEVTISIDEIAAHFGYTNKETLKLLQSLACCGEGCFCVPLVIDDDEAFVSVFSPFASFETPLYLTEAERRALVAAAEAMGIARNDPLYEKIAADSVEMQGARLQTDEQGVHNAMPSAFEVTQAKTRNLLGTLFAAIEDNHVVRISYIRQGEHEPGERDIEPLELTLENGHWYLYAYCLLRMEHRSFLLDNIQSVLDTQRSFERRSDAYDHVSLLLQDEPPLAELRFLPGVSIEKNEWPGINIDTDLSRQTGERLATIPYLSTSWLPTRIAARFGMVEVVEPQKLAAEVERISHSLRDEALAAIADFSEHAMSETLCLAPHPAFQEGEGCSREELLEIVSRSVL